MDRVERAELSQYQRAVVAAAEQHLEEIGVSYRFNRRWFLRMAVTGAATAATGGAIASLVAACGGSSTSSGASSGLDVSKLPKTKKLTGFQFSFWMDPATYDSYQAQFGYKPEFTVFSPPAITEIPKLQQHGDLYDIVSLSSNQLKFFVDADVLQPWDTSAIPNYKNIFSVFPKIDNGRSNGKPYEVPFFWGHNAIAYNADLVDPADGNTVAGLFNPKYKGKVAMQNHAAESFAVAGLYLGVKDPFHMTDAEYQKAKDALVKQKTLVRAYWNQLGELPQLFKSKEVAIAWAWPPIVGMLKGSGVNIKFIDLLKEGGIGWDDGIGLSKRAQNVYEAHVYANWCLGADNIKWIAEHQNYPSTSQQALKVLTPDQVTALKLDDPSAFLSKLAFQDYYYEADKVTQLWQQVQTA